MRPTEGGLGLCCLFTGVLESQSLGEHQWRVRELCSVDKSLEELNTLDGRVQVMQALTGRCLTKILTTMADSLSKRKDLLAYILARERTRSWGKKSNSAASGLDEKDKRIHSGLLYT